MTQGLLKRRLILGPVFTAMMVYVLTAVSEAMGREALPGIVVGGLGSLVIAWYLVRSERSQAHGPAVPKVGVIVTAAGASTLLLRLGPPVLLYWVVVAGIAMFLGVVISSGHELLRGTYADAPRQDQR